MVPGGGIGWQPGVETKQVIDFYSTHDTHKTVETRLFGTPQVHGI